MGLIDINLFSMSVYVGIGVSISANFKTDHKDCCNEEGNMIKYGLRKYIITIHAEGGLGGGIEFTSASGFSAGFLFTAGPTIDNDFTSELKNSTCGGPLDTAKSCKEKALGAEFSLHFSISVLEVVVEGKPSGRIRVCTVVEKGKVYATLEGKGDIDLSVITRLAGIRIERLSRELEEKFHWKEIKRIELFTIGKMEKKKCVG